MSKPIDETKIERIRTAAVSIIARQGITNCSVAAIAEQAGVSVGYLYRHYSGKEALINDLFEINFTLLYEKMRQLIAEEKGLEYVVDGVVRYLLSVAEQNDEKIRFLIMLLNDFSIKIDPDFTARIDALAEELIAMSREVKCFRTDLCKADLFFALVGVPLQYLSFRYSMIISEKHIDVEHVVGIAQNVLKEKN